MALAAAYDQCAMHNFELGNGHVPQKAYVISVDGGADRVLVEAFDWYKYRDLTLMAATKTDVRKAFEGVQAWNLGTEVQKAVMMAVNPTSSETNVKVG